MSPLHIRGKSQHMVLHVSLPSATKQRPHDGHYVNMESAETQDGHMS